MDNQTTTNRKQFKVAERREFTVNDGEPVTWDDLDLLTLGDCQNVAGLEVGESFESLNGTIKRVK